MKIALRLEKELYESLLVLHSLASQYDDPQVRPCVLTKSDAAAHHHDLSNCDNQSINLL